MKSREEQGCGGKRPNRASPDYSSGKLGFGTEREREGCLTESNNFYTTLKKGVFLKRGRMYRLNQLYNTEVLLQLIQNHKQYFMIFTYEKKVFLNMHL